MYASAERMQYEDTDCTILLHGVQTAQARQPPARGGSGSSRKLLDVEGFNHSIAVLSLLLLFPR